MIPRTIGEISLGPNRNLKGSARCFGLLIGWVFQRPCKDVKIHKIPIDVISYLNCVAKKEKSTKVIKFGDSQQKIDNLINAGVKCDLRYLLPGTSNSTKVVCYETRLVDYINRFADESSDDYE